MGTMIAVTALWAIYNELCLMAFAVVAALGVIFSSLQDSQ